ncbi:unnamed protein product, partial [Durusdinium trenchii]
MILCGRPPGLRVEDRISSKDFGHQGQGSTTEWKEPRGEPVKDAKKEEEGEVEGEETPEKGTNGRRRRPVESRVQQRDHQPKNKCAKKKEHQLVFKEFAAERKAAKKKKKEVKIRS